MKIIDLHISNTDLTEKIVEIRSNHKVKLPDAIIEATALHLNAILITADKNFTKIPLLEQINF